MIDYQDLRDCDTSVFDNDAAKWQGLAGDLADRGTDLQTAVNRLADWTGSAADAAKAELAGHRKQFADTHGTGT